MAASQANLRDFFLFLFCWLFLYHFAVLLFYINFFSVLGQISIDPKCKTWFLLNK